MPDSTLYKGEYMKFGWRHGSWEGMADLILGSDKKLFEQMMDHWNGQSILDEKPKEIKRLRKKR